MNKIGILTSGGDAPGMNAAIRAVVKAAEHYGRSIVGFQNGYEGLINGDFYDLTYEKVEDIASKGGTILKTSRSAAFITEEGRQQAVHTLKENNINNLIIVGGEGSFKGAQKLHQLGVSVAAIPGTIDNDLTYTDYSIGFDTTLNTVLDCVRKIKDSGYSHNKTTIVEVMGRYCGDLAVYSALAGEGEIISTPEYKLTFDEICHQLEKKIQKGKSDNLILVTERMYDLQELQHYIQEKMQVSARTTVLGFIQRGGEPSAFDRVLAAKMGVEAVSLLLNGQSGAAVGIRNNRIIHVSLDELEEQTADKSVNESLLRVLLP
ncbi:6-phosphofructokinase [Domibacillus sp. PGB-M46]|uniref:6-phosphofructokinase n=1 Tax=Domibacillus sp. PGB-M46 TaxID=2910255 RepID=UPI001F5678DF|nr:6-phosphofructokinase [Domibacillus sp. PGB-M46]MCI2257031.1 6-phosphofructokinase [Domibacillus sp. PGB-M46]